MHFPAAAVVCAFWPDTGGGAGHEQGSDHRLGRLGLLRGLVAVPAERPEVCSGHSVLELGAGCGLCSMVASLTSASRIVASDGDARVVEHLPEIFDANRAALPRRPEVPPPLKWEEVTFASSKAIGAPFDIILGADVTYVPANALVLANALVANAGPDTRVLLSHKRRQPEDDATIAKLAEYFHVETLLKKNFVTVYALQKRDAGLQDLDVGPQSKDNCMPGRVRRGNLCIPES